MKRRSWCTVLPASGATPAATSGFNTWMRSDSASASVRRDARTLSTSPDLPCVDLFHASIASRTASGWWITSTGASRMGLRSASVTTIATSRMRSRSGTRPDISMSIQTSGVLSCAMLVSAASWRPLGSAIVSRSARIHHRSVTVTTFTALFVTFVLAALAWRAWLGVRQARHVQRHRDRVPPDFEHLIPIDAHRKAADYTLDKQRIAMVEAVAIDGALLLFLTVGGGLAAIDAVSHKLFGDGTLRELGTIYGVLGVGLVAALPFDLWRTFHIEAR